MPSSPIVALASSRGPIAYPAVAPYAPEEAYPELQGRVPPGNQANPTYDLFRRLARTLGLDSTRFSTAAWNPLGDIVRPGQKVVIKPNLVYHLHSEGGDYAAVVTHGSLVRCALDYVARALEGQGEITVGDAPLQSANFERIVEQTGLRQICEHVSQAWQIPVRLVDFRLWSVAMDGSKRVVSGGSRSGDQAGYCSVDLGERSLLAPWNGECRRFRVTNYEPEKMSLHHNEKTHEYLVPRTILDADVVINLPKLKTHRKVGLTAALKNLVGINGHKDWLPHHRTGSVAENGDEYREPSLVKRALTRLQESMDRMPYSRANGARRLAMRAGWRFNRSFGSDPFYEGSWYGNDTLWRTVLDLNRLLVYADRDGAMRQTPQRRCLTIVDAIVAGEGEGPLEPNARPCGLLAGGLNPVAVDAVLATVIGFDYRKLPLIARAFDLEDWPLTDFQPSDIELASDDARFTPLKVGNPFTEFNFKPPAGWRGHVECLTQSPKAPACRDP
jgi:uncharacterized protein (DUF362 family)